MKKDLKDLKITSKVDDTYFLEATDYKNRFVKIQLDGNRILKTYYKNKDDKNYTSQSYSVANKQLLKFMSEN